jgi:FkbM family methyltransferase
MAGRGAISEKGWVDRIQRRINRVRNVLRAPGRVFRRWKVVWAKSSGTLLLAHYPDISVRMLVNPDSFFAGVYVDGHYESDLVHFLDGVAMPGMVCVDVGANVGYFSLFMAKKVFPNGKVYSFEPTRQTYEVLDRNVRLNGFFNVEPSDIALSDVSGRVQLMEGPPGFDVYNSLGQVTHPCAAGQRFTPAMVASSSLDEYMSSRNIRVVDIVKIDVEGWELPVLKGMEQLISGNPQMVIVVEMAEQTTSGCGYLPSAIVDYLHARDMTLYVLGAKGTLRECSTIVRWRGEMVIAVKDNCVSH